jgi:small GTP-binding protein
MGTKVGSRMTDYLIILVGAPAVGKTCLVQRFVKGYCESRYRSTVLFDASGRCCACVHVSEERMQLVRSNSRPELGCIECSTTTCGAFCEDPFHRKVCLNILNIAGDMIDKPTVVPMLQRASAVVTVVDASRFEETLQEAHRWDAFVDRCCSNRTSLPRMILVNKSDLRVLSDDEIERIIAPQRRWFSVSAQNGSGINEAMSALVVDMELCEMELERVRKLKEQSSSTPPSKIITLGVTPGKNDSGDPKKCVRLRSVIVGDDDDDEDDYIARRRCDC